MFTSASSCRAVHLHTDDFWSYIVSGGLAPYEPEAHTQNHVVLDVIARAAFAYAAGGFTTVVDGVVGPWMLHHFLDRSREHRGVLLHYGVLRPAREITLERAQQRTAPAALVDEIPVLSMWDQFADLSELETHVVDTSLQTPAASSRLIAEGIDRQRFRLGPLSKRS